MKPIHPLVLKAVPEISHHDYLKLREGIRSVGRLIHPIVLYKDQIIDGRTREKICEELGIAPQYTQYDSTLSIAEYILQTNLRRNLTSLQMDAMILALGREVLPQLREEAKKAKKNGNAKGGTAKSPHERVATPDHSGDVQKRFRRLVSHPRKADYTMSVLKHEDLAAGVEKQEMSLKEAAEIARKRNREAREPKPPKSRKSVENTKPKREIHNQAYYWEKYKARMPRGAETYEKVCTPTTFPLDAKIPSGDTPAERSVREAIIELRKNEPMLPKLGKLKLEELIYPYTQRIQTYVANPYPEQPRPEGELDQRLAQWAVEVAKRMCGLHDFYRFMNQQKELEAAAREESQETNRPRLSEFEYYFRDLWEAERPFLSKFKIRELDQLKERWLERVDRYFQHRAKNAQYLAENRANNGSIK